MLKQSLKEYSKEAAKEIVKALSKNNVKEVKGEGEFEVIATTEGVDRDGEIILVKGWDFANFMKNPVLLFGHDYWSWPIGAVTEVITEDDKVIAKGVFARTEEGQKARMLYEDGILKTVSVGFIPKERNGNVITKAELLELSFVPVPSNPEALDMKKQVKEFEGMMKTNVRIDKAVVAFAETEAAPEDQEWDETVALEAVKEWATEGEEDKLDIDKYKQAFAYIGDGTEGSAKLLHHTVEGDKLMVVWQGVLSAMTKLLSEDGAGIPDDERQAVYGHLAKHFEQFGKEVPAFKSYTPYELDNLFPTEKSKLSVDQKDACHYIVKTMTEDVNNLLAGAVEKIGAVIGEPNNAKPITKAGRTLSSKTRSSINNAVDAMGKTVEALKKLLESADASDTEDGKSADLDLLKDLRGLDKTVERAIKNVKERVRK